MTALINTIVLVITLLSSAIVNATALDEEFGNHFPVGTMCAYEEKVFIGEIKEMNISEDSTVVSVVLTTGQTVVTNYDLKVGILGEGGNDIVIVPDRTSGTFVYSIDGERTFSPMPQ